MYIPATTIGKRENMKKLTILATVIIIVTVISAYYFLTSNTPSPLLSEPTPLLDMKLMPTGQLNTTQGGITRLNITLTSLNMNKTEIPLSLILQTYDNEPLDSAVSKEELFSSTFTVNPIVLETNDTVTSVLTLHVAEATPAGKYTFLVELGSSQIHHVTGTTFDLAVAPSS
jgi:hypothetical protein